MDLLGARAGWPLESCAEGKEVGRGWHPCRGAMTPGAWNPGVALRSTPGYWL